MGLQHQCFVSTEKLMKKITIANFQNRTPHFHLNLMDIVSLLVIQREGENVQQTSGSKFLRTEIFNNDSSSTITVISKVEKRPARAPVIRFCVGSKISCDGMQCGHPILIL
jgi:hypothetical protein